ncbi:hypothetical protein Ac42p237 [Acinetobacter phage Ac42]|uniref:hypothetical protein n=1 Tax=Acinetobacter phage Ac42 TaxID=762660 RepID=UPI0001EBCE15|nr:hypothetical protein Ac42p237 [Acinetobacter phage Ac42]ADI96473.1 hypothetical protein Ac42p237 [Acinetobacter phage Ac42]
MSKDYEALKSHLESMRLTDSQTKLSKASIAQFKEQFILDVIEALCVSIDYEARDNKWYQMPKVWFAKALIRFVYPDFLIANFAAIVFAFAKDHSIHDKYKIRVHPNFGLTSYLILEVIEKDMITDRAPIKLTFKVYSEKLKSML